MRERTAWLAVLAAALLLAGLAGPAPAGETSVEREPREPRTHGFDTRISLGVEYDDNPRHLRDDAIEEFELGLADPDRYRIESVEDWVYIPEIRLGYSSTPKSRRTTRVRLGARLDRHDRNSVLDDERSGLFVEQDQTDAR